MNEMNRLRYITRYYSELQGLRMLPIGFFFLIIAVQWLEVLPWLGKQGDLTAILPLLIIAIALWYWLGRWYDRSFGRVEPLRGGLASAGSIALLVLLIGILVLENVLFQRNLDPPVSLLGLFISVIFLYSGVETRRWYFVLSGALLSFASLLPWIMGVGIGDSLYGSIGIIFMGLLGMIFIISGLLDHLRLVRSFEAAQGGHNG